VRGAPSCSALAYQSFCSIFSSAPIELLKDGPFVDFAQQYRDTSWDADVSQATVNMKGVQVVLHRSSHKIVTLLKSIKNFPMRGACQYEEGHISIVNSNDSVMCFLTWVRNFHFFPRILPFFGKVFPFHPG
jgi:hypothetical protein